MLLGFICFSGCVSKPGTADTFESDSNLKEEIIRQDEEGLVTVRIADGGTEITLDLELWDMLYNIYDVNAEFYDPSLRRGGPFPIKCVGDNIKDACIGKVAALDYYGYEFITPAVILLMEDGTLEYTLAYPYPNEADWVYQSQGKLPWLKDIVSLAYKKENEGKGEMTIFATDRDGLIYDVRNVCHMTGIFEDEWLFQQSGDSFPYWRYCTLRFSESNNEMLFTTGLNSGGNVWDYGEYTGSYEITLAENDIGGRRPGLFSFFLSVTSGSKYDDRPNDRIVGTCFISAPSAPDGMTLELWYSDGDYLAHGADGNPLTELSFFRPMDSDYDFWRNGNNWINDDITKTYMSSDEARTILQAWADSHPFQLSIGIKSESDEYILGGVEYYRFYLGVERFGVIEIFVHKKTGKLFHYMSPGNIAFEPLDDYYNREHNING